MKLLQLSALGSVYTGPDPFGTGTKMAQISLVFTWDLVNPVRIVSGTKMSPLMTEIPYETVPFQFRTGPVYRPWIRTIVDPIPNVSECIQSL